MESGDTLLELALNYTPGDYIALIKELNGIEDENKFMLAKGLSSIISLSILFIIERKDFSMQEVY